MINQRSRAASQVTDNVSASRYEIRIDGGVAVLTYMREAGRITLDHTRVPPSLRGRGLATRLAAYALNEARVGDVTVVPRCPFVRAYLQSHPEAAPRLA